MTSYYAGALSYLTVDSAIIVHIDAAHQKGEGGTLRKLHVSHRLTHAHVTRRVILLFLELVTSHNASAAINRVTPVNACQCCVHMSSRFSPEISTF